MRIFIVGFLRRLLLLSVGWLFGQMLLAPNHVGDLHLCSGNVNFDLMIHIQFRWCKGLSMDDAY